jgi:hypothetical protein
MYILHALFSYNARMSIETKIAKNSCPYSLRLNNTIRLIAGVLPLPSCQAPTGLPVTISLSRNHQLPSSSTTFLLYRVSFILHLSLVFSTHHLPPLSTILLLLPQPSFSTNQIISPPSFSSHRLPSFI